MQHSRRLDSPLGGDLPSAKTESSQGFPDCYANPIADEAPTTPNVDKYPELEQSNERIAIVRNHFKDYNSPLKGFS
jgi:hypothetical protein